MTEKFLQTKQTSFGSLQTTQILTKKKAKKQKLQTIVIITIQPPQNNIKTKQKTYNDDKKGCCNPGAPNKPEFIANGFIAPNCDVKYPIKIVFVFVFLCFLFSHTFQKTQTKRNKAKTMSKQNKNTNKQTNKQTNHHFQ